MPGETPLWPAPGSADAALPVAAAFFFLLKKRNVIPAGPRQGWAPAPSPLHAMGPPLTWPCPPGLGTRGKEEEKHKCRSNRPRRGQGPYRMFYSPASGQERALRGEHRHPQVHRCSTQPSEKNLRRGFFFFHPQDQPRRRAARAGKAKPYRSISKPEKSWKTAVRRSWPRGYSATGRHGNIRRPMNPRTRPAPSRGRCRQAARRVVHRCGAAPHPVCIHGAWPGKGAR
jgi:hypothetical protein